MAKCLHLLWRCTPADSSPYFQPFLLLRSRLVILSWWSADFKWHGSVFCGMRVVARRPWLTSIARYPSAQFFLTENGPNGPKRKKHASLCKQSSIILSLLIGSSTHSLINVWNYRYWLSIASSLTRGRGFVFQTVERAGGKACKACGKIDGSYPCRERGAFLRNSKWLSLFPRFAVVLLGFSMFTHYNRAKFVMAAHPSVGHLGRGSVSLDEDRRVFCVTDFLNRGLTREGINGR